MLVLTADRIKKLRESKGWSQVKLSKKLGITRSSVNAWEMGVSSPSTQKIVEFALLFQTSTDYLLGLDDEKTLSLRTLTDKEIELIYQLLNYIEYIKNHNQ